MREHWYCQSVSANQVPLWVTLAIALLTSMMTLLGAVGAQWVAASSARNRERERAKSERESRWEARRFDVLASYVVLAEEMIDVLCRGSFLVAEKQDLERGVVEGFSRLQARSREELSKLRLSLPPDLHYECQIFHKFFCETSFTIERKGDPVIEDSHMSGNDFARRLERLVHRMQQELGIDDPNWW